MENTIQYYLIEADRYKNLLQTNQKLSEGQKNNDSFEQDKVSINKLVDFPSKNKTEQEPENNKEDYLIIRCFPKNSVNRCKMLLDHIRMNGVIKWNNLGNVIVNDHLIDQSHIIDLLRFCLLPAKDVPIGWDQFSYGLAKSNIPLSIISNSIAKGDISEHSISMLPDGEQVGHGDEGESSDTRQSPIPHPPQPQSTSTLTVSTEKDNQHISSQAKPLIPPPPGYSVEQFKKIQKGEGDIKGEEKKSPKKKIKKEVKVQNIKGLKWLIP